MSAFDSDASVVLGKLENIEHMPLTHSERESLTKGVVFGEQSGSGDVSLFITSITNVDSSNLFKILAILEKYDDFAVSLVTSTSLSSVFNLAEGQLKANSKVLSVLLEFCLKAVSPSAISLISKANIIALGAFANRCIQHVELEVANVASKLNEKLIKFYPDELIAAAASFIQSSSNTTIQLRFVSLLTHEASLSSELFQKCVSAGVIGTVVRLCREPDVLMQINALDFLPLLASTTAGLDYLCDQGVLSWLIAVACEESSSTSFDPVLCTEALRVLGSVFNKASSVSYDLSVKLPGNSVKLFLEMVTNYLEDRSESHKIAAVGILCDFARVSLNTLKIVVENNRLMGEWVGLLKSSSKPELSGAVLHSIAKVLHEDDALYTGAAAEGEGATGVEERRQAVVRLKKQLLLQIDETKAVHYPVYLLKMATSPITPVRYAAVDVMTAMAAQPSGWGLLILSQINNDNGGFMGYLTNRETEYCKEGKEWKYSLIQAIHDNPARQMLSETFNKSVDLMVRQGAYYMPPRMAEMLTV